MQALARDPHGELLSISHADAYRRIGRQGVVQLQKPRRGGGFGTCRPSEPDRHEQRDYTPHRHHRMPHPHDSEYS